MPDKPLMPENTSVFILAAGRGKRMMPLTNNTPKPLLKVAGKSLIEHHLSHIAKKGFKHVVINIDYHGEKIIEQLGNGRHWGLQIDYSDERESGALETAGGIRQALALIKSDYFLCINADIWTDFNLMDLLGHHQIVDSACIDTPLDASIVLIQNPSHNPEGDFGLNFENHRVLSKKNHQNFADTYTFSGIACHRKHAFSELTQGKQALKPLLDHWSDQQSLSGLIFSGEWHDIGTPARLQEINDSFKKAIGH